MAAERLGDLEIAARRRIERDKLARGFHMERTHVVERCLLRRVRVREQRTGGTDCKRRSVGAKRFQIDRAELLRQPACRVGSVEVPCWQSLQRRAAPCTRAITGTGSVSSFSSMRATSSASRKFSRCV